MSLTSDLMPKWASHSCSQHWDQSQTVMTDDVLVEEMCRNYFLIVLLLARFSLSIKRRSEAEHLERTTPISDSFLRSMAASAAPSRSLEKDNLKLLAKRWGVTWLTIPHPDHLMARWARTFCSGVTLETYFLASYLLLHVMQTSTKGWIRDKRLEQKFRFICSKHFRYTKEEWNQLFVLTR